MIQVSEFDFSSTQPGIIAARSVDRKTEEAVYIIRKGTKDVIGRAQLTADDHDLGNLIDQS